MSSETVDVAQPAPAGPMPPSDPARRPVPAPVQQRVPQARGVGALARPGAPALATRIPPSLQAKMAAMASRSSSASTPTGVESATAALMRAGLSDSAVTGGRTTSPFQQARRRPGFKLSDIGGAGSSLAAAGLGAGRPSLDMPPPPRQPQGNLGTPFANFSKIVDPSGALNFGGKAVLNASGVNFSTGQSFAINMGELQLEEELGRGNYGTVKKVLHKPTNVAMAMKEIRLELDDAKLNAIIMELDILHRATSPEIVEFYGAFFIESCVYYCMEYMDAGSLDKLQTAGVPEDVLGRITGGMVRGLKFLKDELQVMHRDVKPTNVLVNRAGAVKLCDFGVSGQLEKSLAKTNIGCQSYMAPERIKGESQNNLSTYTVSSDVWSLGLSMIEVALGKYPYPPETYSNVFAQLQAIVHGDPPSLPDGFSDEANDFVGRCLIKEPEVRATYTELLDHPFLVADRAREVDMTSWVAKALELRSSGSISSASSTTSASSADESHPS